MKLLPAHALAFAVLFSILCSHTARAAEDNSGAKADAAISALQTAGKYADAEQAAQALVTARIQALGADNPETRLAHRALAAALFAQEKLEAAEAEYRLALQLPDPETDVKHSFAPATMDSPLPPPGNPSASKAEAKAGAPPPIPADEATLLAHQDFASVLTMEGKLDEAAGRLHALLPVMVRTLGAENRQTLLCKSDLVSVLATHSHTDEAEALSRSLIPAATRVLGAEDPATLKARGDFAGILFYQGKIAEAEKEMREVLALSTRVLGAEDKEALRASIMLAKVSHVQDKNADAEAWLEKLLPVMIKVFGADHLETLVCQSDLLAAMAAQGKNAQVVEPYRRLIPTEQRVLGEADDITLQTRWRFAGVLYELGLQDEAEAEYRQAQDLSQRRISLDDRLSLTAPATEAADHHLRGKYALAEFSRRRLIFLQTRFLGPQHPDTLRSRTDLAEDLEAQGKRPEAEAELRAVLALQERAFGPLNPETLGTRRTLAECLQAQKKTPEALAEAQRALAGHLKILGEDHPDTMASQHLVAALSSPALHPPQAKAAPAKPDPADRPLATVDGEPITTADLQGMIQAQEQQLRYQFRAEPKKAEQKIAEFKRTALDTLIDSQLLANEFKHVGGVIRPEHLANDLEDIIQTSFQGDRGAFLADLDKQGMSLEKFRALRQRLMMIYGMRRRITAEIKPTEEQVRAYYDKHKEDLARAAEEVKLHTLTLLKTLHKTDAEARAQAEALRTQILQGADFEKIARAESKDSHADDGGAWGWTPAADLSEDVRAAAAALKQGALSEVIEQTGFYLLLRVDDRRTPAPPPYDSVKEKAAAALQEELGQELIEKKINHLRELADIQKLGPV